MATKQKKQRLTRYEADVLRSARDNHMWINAFACIRPSDDLKKSIGEYVLAKLADGESTIQADYDNFKVLRDLKQPEVIIRFNKS